MKSIIESLGKNIKTWTGEAAEKAAGITKAAASKAEELSKVGRLRMDIYQLQRDQSRLYADLGRIAYEVLGKAAGPSLAEQPGVDKLHQRIAGIGKDIKAKEKKIKSATTPLAEPIRKKAPGTSKEPAPAAEKKPGKAGTKAARSTGAGKSSTAKKTVSAGKTTSGKVSGGTGKKTAGTGAKEKSASK